MEQGIGADVLLPKSVAPHVLDTNGLDVGPILAQAAMDADLPLVLLLTVAKAESNFDPNAFRNGVWPDVSCGGFQQSVAYGLADNIGNGSNTPANIALCRQELADWTVATNVATRNLKPRYLSAQFAQFSGDDLILATCSSYNSGSVQPFGNWWWQSPQFHNYRAALTWAQGVLE